MTESKHKVSEVYPKVRHAISILLGQDKYDLGAAAAGAGLTLPKLKEYLNRPSVRSYFRGQRRVQIEALCASNANALARVRDEGENAMAIVNAVRQAESMRARFIDEDGPGGISKPACGLVIVIGNQSGGGTVIEQKLAGAPRVIEAGAHERGSDDPDDFLGDNFGDQALDALPPPVRPPVKPARRRKSPGAAR
jgi:hypothetical protein